ncbi:helix-turn-helix domain-containing protein [Streptomyces morookaense]|uniref:Helix-turn-helix domain-containing protein n=1 Tax=Streptomyces morookaense TaxID=1970 RepID=A0A7Y7E727_STRMO|nr:helix-turn-helix transcriptional regulator [Streptomyces morookaense]NVK78558.1 helix-turn-helix domain-containing protein [Streptomyces morookaense]
MAARRGPTFRRRELGKQLRLLREKAGITIEEAAAALAFSETKLTRVETAHNSLPRVGDLEKLLDLYGVENPDSREALLVLHRDSLSREWWTPYRNTMWNGMDTFLGLERDARTLRSWQPDVVPGLLQCESYARALFLSEKQVEETTTPFVDDNVRLRMERKDILTRADGPVELNVVVNEAALRQWMGSKDVMLEQYEEVERLAQLHNVTVQILPMMLANYRTCLNFMILDFDEGLEPVVQTDLQETITVTDKPLVVGRYARRFDALQRGALAPSVTPEFLHRLAREIDSH